MKISRLLPALGIMLVITGCTSVTTMNSDKNSNSEAQSQNASATSSEAAPLSDAELKEFTDLFNTAEYNGFLENAFNSPEDIDWDSVIYNGAGIATRNAGVAEINDYLASIGMEKLDSEAVLYVIKKSDLAKFIKKNTGMDFVPKTEDISWDYSEKYDSFYYYTSYMLKNALDYTCVSGEKKGEQYTLRFETNINSEESGEANTQEHYGYYADRILTLTKSGNDIIFKSNEIRWDDHCDEKLTMDVTLPQYDKPIHVVTYNEDPINASVVLVKDGKSIIKGHDNNQLSILKGCIFFDEPMDYYEVCSLDFFDFNADGLKDLAVIQNSPYGKFFRLLNASPNNGDFSLFAELDEESVSKITSTFSIDSFKTILLADNGEGKKNDYKQAYAQITHVYESLFDSLKYDLIYADDDDIPELVIEKGSVISLYTYKNNMPYCLMHDEFNSFFDPAGTYDHCFYAPKKDIYYIMSGNQYHDNAVDKTYLSKDENAELQTLFKVRNLKSDVKPSTPEALESAKDNAGITEYENETDKKMTTDEIKAMVNLYDSYEKKELAGTMDYDTLLTQLK